MDSSGKCSACWEMKYCKEMSRAYIGIETTLCLKTRLLFWVLSFTCLVTTNYVSCLELLAPSYEVLHWLYSHHSRKLWSARIGSKLLLYMKGILAFELVHAHSPGSLFSSNFHWSLLLSCSQRGVSCKPVQWMIVFFLTGLQRELFMKPVITSIYELRGVTGHSFRVKMCSSYMGSFVCFSSKFII